MAVNTFVALLAATSALLTVRAQSANSSTAPSFAPTPYPNEPTTALGPDWQNYFQVTEKLPNVTWTLPRNFAGNIPVNRTGHPDDTLFFWAFEKENGSLTAGANEKQDEPWGIWLNGGPGSSSMIGMMLENGPIRIHEDYSAQKNNYSWDRIADYVWIDQPVGSAFSTADSEGYVVDEDQMASDFIGFLANLVKVFPSLAKRPLHITGESYAGTFIPYITKALFESANPPVNLKAIAIGNGKIGSDLVAESLPTVNLIETYPQLIGYDKDVYNWFREQEHLCGYDLNLTYPQNGKIPSLRYVYPTERNLTTGPITSRSDFNKRAFPMNAVAQLAKRSEMHKRDLTGRANGTIDGWYGCLTSAALLEYALNYSTPWTSGHTKTIDGFDVYDIPDALYPKAPQDASIFLNDNATKAAIHAPANKTWTEDYAYPFGSVPGTVDPSVEPMAFLDELAANATKRGVRIVIYSGNDDALVPHRGSEVVIQNTTFGGIQGFTRKPSTPFTDDAGNWAGIVHQERNWTYALFNGAGHQLPFYKPAAAFAFAREFIFGNNQTGLVTNSSGSATVVGGENSALAAAVLPGGSEIYYGSGTTQSTYVAPTATVEAWNSFIATAAPSGDSSKTTTNAASTGKRNSIPVVAMSCLFLFSML